MHYRGISSVIGGSKGIEGIGRVGLIVYSGDLGITGRGTYTDYYEEEAVDTGLLNDKTSFMRGSG